MKKLLVTLFVVLLLVGCVSKDQEEVVTVCSISEPSDIYESAEQTFTSKGDVVTKWITKGVLDGGDKSYVDDYMELMDEVISVLNSQKGVTASVERISDTKVSIIEEVDLEVADLQELSKSGLIGEGTDGIVEFVSLKQSVHNLELRGFTCR